MIKYFCHNIVLFDFLYGMKINLCIIALDFKFQNRRILFNINLKQMPDLVGQSLKDL